MKKNKNQPNEILESLNSEVDNTSNAKNNKKSKKNKGSLIQESNFTLDDNNQEATKNEKQKKQKKQKAPPATIENDTTKKSSNDEINFEELKDYGTALGLSEEKIKEINAKTDYKLLNKNTELVLNVKVFNRFVDYLPSDFTSGMVRRIFLIKKKMNLPKGVKLKVALTPNDSEKTLRVLVSVNKYYKAGALIEQAKIFDPFWIIGFGTYTFITTLDQPTESLYRVNNMHSFAFAQSQNMRRKKILPKFTNRSKSSFEVEEDFIRARNNKNWYLQQYIDGLNRLKNVEWECFPKININWSSKIIKLDLYLKIDKIKQDLRKTRWVYVDSFTVKAGNVLDIPADTKIVDIDSVMYLIALNAIYKNIKVFSYKTLYETYKIMSAELLSRGFRLKPISPNNLATLKIVDFSKHFWCKNLIFNDAILHIMNLMSSQEDYYRMKYAYTVQKNPTLLFSDFIVKEFKTVKTNELSTIIKNQEDKYWKEQLKKIEDLNNITENKNKDFYINNYNVLDLTNNTYHDVESYLMGIIKGEKDELTRISKLGEELLKIDEDPRFTKKESKELRKVAKKLDDNYKDLFLNMSESEFKKATSVKPIELDDVRKKKPKKEKKHQDQDTNNNDNQQVASDNNQEINNDQNYEGVNNG